MAWLFGSSKKSKPEVYVSNEVEDGFNVVSLGPTPAPRYSMGMPSPGPQAGPGYPLYPPLPGSQHTTLPGPPYLAICPQAPPGYKPRPVHPLDSIPFRLSTGLDSSSLSRKTVSDLERIKNSLTQINTRLHSPEFSYSFELERSVLRESGIVAN